MAQAQDLDVVFPNICDDDVNILHMRVWTLCEAAWLLRCCINQHASKCAKWLLRRYPDIAGQVDKSGCSFLDYARRWPGYGDIPRAKRLAIFESILEITQDVNWIIRNGRRYRSIDCVLVPAWNEDSDVAWVEEVVMLFIDYGDCADSAALAQMPSLSAYAQRVREARAALLSARAALVRALKGAGCGRDVARLVVEQPIFRHKLAWKAYDYGGSAQ